MNRPGVERRRMDVRLITFITNGIRSVCSSCRSHSPGPQRQRNHSMFSRIPFEKVNWLISSFLIGTLFLAVTAVPVYLCFFGLDTFQVVLFFVMFFSCGFSITIGYHRLFSHRTFEAHWFVRLLTLIFGAAAFENSVLLWACEHRSHHKHVDHDDDPYCISKGLFHAHIGWLLFKLDPPPPFDNVADLKKDPLVMWQHRHIHWIGCACILCVPMRRSDLSGADGFPPSAPFSLREWRASSFSSTALFASTRCATISASAPIPQSAVHATRGLWRS